jgi:DNA repair protein RadD
MTPQPKPLRGYQRELVRQVSQAYQAGQRGVLMQSATGSGKTRTGTYIVEKYASTGRQVLWLVHREELLMQAAMVFAEAGVRHRLVCAASSERAIKAQQFREHGRSFVSTDGLVVIASIQTLVRRLDALPWLQPAQIVADECHLSLAATWRRVLDHWPSARLLGLTATPTRLDRQSFARADGGLYDVLVSGPAIADLVGWGNLAKFKVYAPPVHFAEGVKLRTKGGDYDTRDLEAEMNTPVIYGDVIGHYEALSKGKPAIAFCPTVATAERFAQAFRDAGYRAIALDGETDDGVRRRSLQKLGRGELDVVTSVSILTEGTDVPYATTALMLRRTQSLSLYLQAVGRVLRPHPDKEHAIILDFVGVVALHGMPDEPREWTLEGEGKRSKAAKADDEPPVVIATCPKCFTYHRPAPVCPNCGHQYEVKARREMEQVEGTLQEITDAQAEALRRQRMLMQGKAQTVADLHAQGISIGRAQKIIAAREEKSRLRAQVRERHPSMPLRQLLEMKPKELRAALG